MGNAAQHDHVHGASRDDLRDALHRQREMLLARLEAGDAGVRGLREARGDSDGDDEHDPEGSTVSWELVTQRASVDAAERHLTEVDAALARVDRGWDGACAGCGRLIPAARLAVRPSADHCVDCAGRAHARG